MRQGNRKAGKKGWLLCTAVGMGLISSRPTMAGPMGPPSYEPASLGRDVDSQSPMSGRGGGAAPYSVRLRITGFLARQHAREGDTKRALVEYHSMLNVDDPSWPDNADGDSMRIARDMEVARMMAESGFYDHSIRVLETTLILARVDRDPQVDSVERQINAIGQVARMKGITVPQAYLNDPLSSDGVGPVSSESGSREVLQEKGWVSKSAARQSVRQVSDTSLENGQVAPGGFNDISNSSLDQGHVTSAAAPQPFQRTEKKGLLSRFIPSRFKKDVSARPEPQPESVATQRRPMFSPDVSPSYCPECAAERALNPPRAGLGSGVSQGAVATRTWDEPPIQPRDHSPISKIFGRNRPADSDKSISVASKTKSGQFLTPSVVVEPPDSKTELQLNSGSGPALKLTAIQAGHTADGSSTGKLDSDAIDQGPALRIQSREIAEPSSDSLSDDTSNVVDPTQETQTDAASQPESVERSIQVGIAGQVTNPGIFTIEGTSTTLAALLRQAGGDPTQANKQTRILRSVDLCSSVDRQKDFYCQRVEMATSEGKALATPIYGREVIIVDGAGQKPLYIAVMPHFILQLPINPNRPTTADQIVEQLRVYWPNIRNQEIGVLRFEDWGRATKVARLQDDAGSVNAPLSGGDVLYVDGLGLDQPQVMAAAEAVARLAGAKIRQTDSSAPQTANSAK